MKKKEHLIIITISIVLTGLILLGVWCIASQAAIRVCGGC